MADKRAELLADELYWFVFHMLDNESEYNGDDAGQIATKMQHQFLRELTNNAWHDKIKK